MTTYQIERTPFARLWEQPNREDLLLAYAHESGMHEIGQPNGQLDIYLALEAAGVLHTLCAFHDGQMIGFMVLIVSVLPHYGKKTATTESYFVALEHRKTGAGIGLLREAEALAKDLGAAALLVSAPTGSRLDVVMQRQGFRHTNQVYAKGLQ